MTDKKSISHYERELLLAHTLGVSREYVLTHPEIRLNPSQARKFKESIKRRQKNEPLAHILGHREFYGLDFKVSPDALIPRPETEILAEATMEELTALKEKISLIDVGTGSGNIIISIARNIKDKRDDTINFYGLDISSEALRVARYNAKKYQLDNPPAGGIKFIRSDLLEYFLRRTYLLGDRCIFVANLPYLSRDTYASAMPDVKNFEPKSALISGQGGLAHYKRLFLEIKKLKKKNSLLRISCYMEISPEQKKELEKLIRSRFPEARPDFRKDLARKWRICSFKL